MTEAEKHQAIETLYRVADYARIAHHINGRIRIKFNWSAKKELADIELEPLTEQLPGIHHYRYNNRNGSLVIEYDSDLISPHLWEQLMTASSDARPEITKELLAIWKNPS